MLFQGGRMRKHIRCVMTGRNSNFGLDHTMSTRRNVLVFTSGFHGRFISEMGKLMSGCFSKSYYWSQR